MNDDYELQHWQGRVDDMQVLLEGLREERETFVIKTASLEADNAALVSELAQVRSMLSRVQVALSQGVEL